MSPETIVLATLVGSLALFLSDALRYDLVALLVVFVLVGTRCLEPREAFAGLASEAVILISSMYVFGASIQRWGVAEAVGQRLLARTRGGETRLTLKVMLVSGLLSGLMSNTGVVAIMIPITTAVARERRVPVSRVLIPMSYASLGGGMLSLVATSKNLAVNEHLLDHGYRVFSLFEFSHFGLILLILAVLFMIGPGRWLLPAAPPVDTLTERYQVPKFVTEVLVEPNSTMINRAVSDLSQLESLGIHVLGIVRADRDTILAPGAYNRIRRNDTLILQGEPDAILRVRNELGVKLRTSAELGDVRLDSSDVHVVEVVVPAGSPLAGRTLRSLDFHARSGLNVLAVSRDGRVDAEQRVLDRRIEVGDTLLVQGHQRDLERARAEREVLVLDEVPHRPVGRGGLITVGLLAGVLLAVVLDLLPLSVAALAGALGLVLTRCVTVEEAYRSIDFMVIVLIGGMLALGTAFDKHGLDERLSRWILSLGSGQASPRLILAVILVTTALLTQVATHIVSAVLMALVAVQLAQQMGIDDRAFLMGVLTAASCAFMSPVAHVANTMVVGPGNYRYRDFLRAGTPLTAFLLLCAWVLLPWLWPFQP